MRYTTLSFIGVDELARAIHEAGREAVEKGATVAATPGRFLEWDEISEAAREGRRIQARFLIQKYCIMRECEE